MRVRIQAIYFTVQLYTPACVLSKRLKFHKFRNCYYCCCVYIFAFYSPRAYSTSLTELNYDRIHSTQTIYYCDYWMANVECFITNRSCRTATVALLWAAIQPNANAIGSFWFKKFITLFMVKLKTARFKIENNRIQWEYGVPSFNNLN